MRGLTAPGAITFFQTFSGPLEAEHSSTLHHLSSLLLPSHVQNDELAQRFRNEKYAVRMSRSGFNLLIGWLTEGIGGEPSGGDAGFTGERGKRGRAAVMRVVNNHLRFDGNRFRISSSQYIHDVYPVTAATASNLPASAWEESTGLLSALIPESTGSATSYTDPQAFNRMKGELKLGPAPLQEELKVEAERVLREQALIDRDPSSQYDLHYLQPPAPPGTLAPALSDLPPHPPNFKTVDVKREVERVRDARKRIRLEPSALSSVDQDSPQAAVIRARALPSVCAYTIHNVPEGRVPSFPISLQLLMEGFSVPCCTFSADTSLMAAGFAESYIRLWSMKGEKLQGMRSDFSPSNIRDGELLQPHIAITFMTYRH